MAWLRLGSFARDRRGVAAVETALVGSFVLLPLMGGLVGIAQAVQVQNALDRGLHAGLLLAWAKPTLTTTTTPTLQAAVTSAVQDAYGATTPVVTAAPSWYCMSPTGTRGSGTTTTSGGTCTGSQVKSKYVTITVTAKFTPVVDVGINGWSQAGGTAGLVSLSSTATVRVQ